MPRHRLGRHGEVTCPQCKGTGQVTQMAGAMRFNLTCPRAAELASCTTPARLAAARARGAHGDGGGSHSAGRAQRIAAARAGQGQRGHDGRSGGRSLHHDAGRTSILLPARRRQYRDYGPLAVWEARWARRSKCRRSTGATLLKIPQGTKNGQKFRLREKGVLNSRTGQRGDQIVEVSIQAPDPRDEKTRELLREDGGGCIRKTRARSIWPEA